MKLPIVIARPGATRPRQVDPDGDTVPLQTKVPRTFHVELKARGVLLGTQDGDTQRLTLAAGLHLLDRLAELGVTSGDDVAEVLASGWWRLALARRR